MVGLLTNTVCRVAARMLTAKRTGMRRAGSILTEMDKSSKVTGACERNTASTANENAVDSVDGADSSFSGRDRKAESFVVRYTIGKIHGIVSVHELPGMLAMKEKDRRWLPEPRGVEWHLPIVYHCSCLLAQERQSPSHPSPEWLAGPESSGQLGSDSSPSQGPRVIRGTPKLSQTGDAAQKSTPQTKTVIKPCLIHRRYPNIEKQILRTPNTAGAQLAASGISY
jgi:hypothetical protein